MGAEDLAGGAAPRSPAVLNVFWLLFLTQVVLLISRLAMDSLGTSRYRESFFASAIVSLAPVGTFRKAITVAILGIERWATTRLSVVLAVLFKAFPLGISALFIFVVPIE